jgi:hypothetical protein
MERICPLLVREGINPPTMHCEDPTIPIIDGKCAGDGCQNRICPDLMKLNLTPIMACRKDIPVINGKCSKEGGCMTEQQWKEVQQL